MQAQNISNQTSMILYFKEKLKQNSLKNEHPTQTIFKQCKYTFHLGMQKIPHCNSYSMFNVVSFQYIFSFISKCCVWKFYFSLFIFFYFHMGREFWYLHIMSHSLKFMFCKPWEQTCFLANFFQISTRQDNIQVTKYMRNI